MERTPEAAGGCPGEAGFPEESVETPAPGPSQAQVVLAEAPKLEDPESGAKEEEGAAQDLSEEKRSPPPRPGPPREPPLSLGYGAFRRLGSVSRGPPSPGPAPAEQPRGDGEAPGAQLASAAAPGEQTPGPWAPVELQVDVRVKPVGAAGGGCGPSPAPSTRFLTVPVPESPAFARHAASTYPLLYRSASVGSAWGRGSPLAAVRAESEHPGEDRAGLAMRRGDQAGPGVEREEKEGDGLLPHAETDGKKLPREIALMGLPTYMKSLRWALAIMAVLLAVSTVAIVALASTTGAVCRPCPQGWIWSEEQCYYLSSEAQDWETSRAFCSAHQATLPLLSHIQGFLNRYQITKRSWVGAQRGPQGWHWMDGAPLTPQLLTKEDKDKPELSCGGLEDSRLVALDCSSPIPWVCTRASK
ncbi:killer cell lectin-like receptor subfamily G member 2 [Ctenodactylus gundi]